MSSVEYPATVPGVKRALKVTGCSQRRAALGTGQSVALVSMVLAKKARSQPCLDKLAAFLNTEAQTQNGRPERATASRTA